MKKTILASLTLSLLSVSLFAQGTVNFNNRVTGVLFAPVYGPQTGNSTQSLTGQSSIGTPSGTVSYTGALLSGGNYLAELFAAAGSGVAESSLQAGANIITFRTGAGAGYVQTGVTGVLTGVPLDTSVATIQLRVWDNTSGLYNTWAAAETAWLAGTIAAGKSTTFNLNAIGGNINSPPNLTGLTSFNIYTIAAVPEPTTLVLAGLGGLSLLALRRKK